MSDPTVIEVANVVRVLCVVGAAALVGFCFALTRSLPPLTTPEVGKRLVRLALGMAFLGVAALVMQADRIGEPVSWYLPVNSLGVALGLWGSGGLLRTARSSPASR